MSDILTFDQFAGSARGLIARPIAPNNVIVTSALIDTITYRVKNLTDNLEPATGPVPASCLYAAVQPWPKDPKGFTFLWEVDGALWPLALKVYRVNVIFTFKNTLALYPNLAGKSFVLAWQANTTDPLG